MTAAAVVVLHGFAGHADSWNAVRARLPHRRVEAITLFGHDPSHLPLTTVTFEEEVARVAETIASIGERVRLCGYSMGGRVALGILTQTPELVESVVLVGAHPGLESEEQRTARAASDEVWVRVLRDEGIAVFADKWQAQALFASQAKLDPERLATQRNIRLRHNPASLAFAMTSLGLARMPSYWPTLAKLDVPIELVVGALDEKFTALALRMKDRVPADLPRVVSVPEAGHNVLLERPELLADVIAAQ